MPAGTVSSSARSAGTPTRARRTGRLRGARTGRVTRPRFWPKRPTRPRRLHPPTRGGFMSAVLDTIERLRTAAQHPDVVRVYQFADAQGGVGVVYSSDAKAFFTIATA